MPRGPPGSGAAPCCGGLRSLARLPTPRDSTTITLVTTPDVPVHLLTGPPRHGVARYTRDLVAQMPGVPVVTAQDPAELVAAVAGHRRAHLQFTDRLVASSPEGAAELVEAIAGRTRLTVTLHDVPQESDGARNLVRRGAAYARVCAAADGVAVNSRHEAALLGEHGVTDRPVRVIPLGAGTLPIPVLPPPSGAGVTALIAGWIYPGKGHDDVVRAAAAAARRLGSTTGTVLAIGAPSPGHEDDVRQLTALAADLGVTFTVTGGLDDADYAAALRGPGVPVAAHRHLSASRSLLDWGEQGRRPLVAESRYAAEMAGLRPGTLVTYPDDGLVEALVRAVRDPGSTVLPPGTSLRPTLADVAAEYLRWWAES